VLVSNLGLTIFVKQLVKLVKQVLRPALRKRKKKKQLKVRDLTVFSVFAPYCSKSFRHSLSFHKKHICLTGYIRGQKSTSSGVPIHASTGILPLAMQVLLVTLIELFLNYKPSAG
jgi:hypothetical protein